MIFRVFRIYKNIKEGSRDPSGFACGEAFGAVKDILIPFTIVGVLFLVGFFTLGFSNFWFGPSGFFKVLFFLSSFVFLIWFFLMRFILSLTKKMLSQTKKSVDQHIFHDVTPKN